MNTPETPKLPSPFKFVKTVAQSLCDQNGQVRIDTSAHVYLDPRGQCSFCVGVPAYMVGLLRSDFMVYTEKGVDYLQAATAREVLALLYRANMHYGDAVKQQNKTEAIAISFEGLVPVFMDNGLPVDQHWVYKPENRGYHGDAGKTLELTFAILRGFKVGDRFCVFNDGRLETVTWVGSRILPYTPELWAKLLDMRQALAASIAQMGSIFGAGLTTEESISILQRLPLPGFSTTDTTPKRIRRGK